MLEKLKKTKKGFLPFKSERGAIVTALITQTAIALAGALTFGALYGEKLLDSTLANFLIGIIDIIQRIGVSMSSAFLWLTSALLKIVVEPNFIRFSFTGIDNPAISAGWPITRDLANMGIVLVLIIIGLATILKIESYQFKKTLPTLIIIALLINFSPVILGVVVDASNIVMYSFLQESGYNTFSQVMVDQNNNINKAQENKKEGEIDTNEQLNNSIQNIGATMALGAFGFIAGLIYLIFAIIFLCRYVAIWMLVILSPIAFVAYILPHTRKLIFEKWLGQFLSWCFIGATAAFFLYLGNVLLVRLPSVIAVDIQETNKNAGTLASILAAFIPYIVAIAFLVLGLFTSLITGAKGAVAAVNLSKKYGTKAGRLTGRAGMWAGKRGLAFTKEKMPEGVKRVGERMAIKKRWGQGEKGFKGWAKQTINAPWYHARRAAGTIFGTDVNESQKTKIKEAQEKMKGKTIQTKASTFNSALRDVDKIGVLNQAIDDKEFDDVVKSADISDDEIRRLIGQGKKWNAHKAILRANPHLADTPTTVRGRANIRRAVTSMKPTDYGNMSGKTLDMRKRESQIAVDAMIREMNQEQMREGFKSQGNKFSRAIENRLDTIGQGLGLPAGLASRRRVLERTNPRLYKYLLSQAGQGFINL